MAEWRKHATYGPGEDVKGQPQGQTNKPLPIGEWLKLPSQIIAAVGAVAAVLSAIGYMPWFKRDQDQFEARLEVRLSSIDTAFRENLAYIAGATDERISAITRSVEGLVLRSDSMEWTRLEAKRIAGVITVDERIRYCDLSQQLGLEGVGCNNRR